MEQILRRLKALISGAYSEVDLARNDLVFRDNEVTIEALSNAEELLTLASTLIAEELGDDYDVEELNFDERW